MLLKIQKIPLLVRTVVLFLSAQIIALAVAEKLKTVVDFSLSAGEGIDITSFLTYFFVGTVLMVLLMRYYHGGSLYRGMFYAVVFVGLVTVFQTIMPLGFGLVCALAYLVALQVIPKVWVHDLAIVLSSAGIGASFGIQFGWQVVVLILVILSVYDIIAVYGTKHMVAMANTMLTRHAIFALFVPDDAVDYNVPTQTVAPGAGFLILGGGDLVLPMFLSVAGLSINTITALLTIGGMIGGIVLNHALLTRYTKPIPALPAIATGAIIGFLIGYLMSNAV